MSEPVVPGSYYGFGGHRWVLAEDFERLLDGLAKARAELAETKACWDECNSELRRRTAAVHQLERELAEAKEDLRKEWLIGYAEMRDEDLGTLHVITDEQIDAAWRHPDSFGVMYWLGIVACEKCGGSGEHHVDYPLANGTTVRSKSGCSGCAKYTGRGWVRRGDE